MQADNQKTRRSICEPGLLFPVRPVVIEHVHLAEERVEGPVERVLRHAVPRLQIHTKN